MHFTIIRLSNSDTAAEKHSWISMMEDGWIIQYVLVMSVYQIGGCDSFLLLQLQSISEKVTQIALEEVENKHTNYYDFIVFLNWLVINSFKF